MIASRVRRVERYLRAILDERERRERVEFENFANLGSLRPLIYSSPHIALLRAVTYGTTPDCRCVDPQTSLKKKRPRKIDCNQTLLLPHFESLRLAAVREGSSGGDR